MNKIYHVQFPGLNFSVNISPVAFKVGAISVYWYGIIICIGFLTAFAYCLKNVKRFDLDEDSFIDAVMVGTLTAIVGARLYYVVFYSGDTFIKDPVKFFFINEGGLGIYGGILGALAGGFIVSRVKKINFLRLLDLACLGFLIGQAIGRWGNFTNQEAFGSETDSIFRMVSENTNMKAVHPCFLYESFWCFIGFVLIHLFSLKLKKYDGQLFYMYLVWYGIGRFFIENLRTDSLLVPYTQLKISQLVAIITAVIGIVMMIKKLRQSNSYANN